VHGESPASRLPTLNYCTRLGGWPMPTTGISGMGLRQMGRRPQEIRSRAILPAAFRGRAPCSHGEFI
jgi:hypothetical protein